MSRRRSDIPTTSPAHPFNWPRSPSRQDRERAKPLTVERVGPIEDQLDMACEPTLAILNAIANGAHHSGNKAMCDETAAALKVVEQAVGEAADKIQTAWRAARAQIMKRAGDQFMADAKPAADKANEGQHG